MGIRLIAAIAALVLLAMPVSAQTNFGITPSGATPPANLAVSSSSARVQLGTTGTSVVIENIGATDAFLAFGTSSVTATTAGYSLRSGTSKVFNLPASSYVAAITSSSTTTIAITQGFGATALGGGGGSGSGGGGAVTIADGADVTEGAIADAAVTAGAAGTVSAKLRSISRDIASPIPDCGATPCTNNVGVFYIKSEYPAGATPITASATGTTGATTATLAGTSGKTTYICGYSIRANATGATTVTNTITGVITATLSSIMWVAPLASGIGIDEQIFSPCIPASATNTGIAIVSGAPGSGGNVSSKGWGYQL